MRFKYDLNYRQKKTYGPIDGELVVAIVPDTLGNPMMKGFTTVRHRDMGAFNGK